MIKQHSFSTLNKKQGQCYLYKVSKIYRWEWEGRELTVHDSEVVKVTRETEQCKTCFSSYKLKTEVQKKLKLFLK